MGGLGLGVGRHKTQSKNVVWVTPKLVSVRHYVKLGSHIVFRRLKRIVTFKMAIKDYFGIAHVDGNG